MRLIPNDTGGVIWQYDWLLLGVCAIGLIFFSPVILWKAGLSIPVLLLAAFVCATGLWALRYAAACWRQLKHNPEDVNP